MQLETDDERAQTMTLEAFADTIVPGEKRSPDDRAVAGASEGGGAVACGAVELLRGPEGGLAPALDNLADALNAHAEEYADEREMTLDPAVPPFVALPFADRTILVSILTGPGHPEKDLWVSMTMLSNMAYDTAAHISTHDALAAGHPGLLALGITLPDADFLWRFPEHSYGIELNDRHPATTPSGSPA